LNYYGSKEWANSCLKIGIQECLNFDRVRAARLSEIDYFIKELQAQGWPWQSRILRSWKYRCWHDLKPLVEMDPAPLDPSLQPLKGADSIKRWRDS